jgi:multidrug efflux pump subunit AcrA (membrane-fusion protein)
MRPRTHPTDSLETQPLLLPTDVPARVASWTAWLFLAVFAAAIVFACTVRLPETVSASFVLEPGQGSDQLVRLTVPESAFARLKPGQEVRLRYNAYPYQRYGSAAAILDRITPAAVDSALHSAVHATGILQAGPAGHTVEPRPGMRGEARILIGRKTLFQKVLEPLSGMPDRDRR